MVLNVFTIFILMFQLNTVDCVFDKNITQYANLTQEQYKKIRIPSEINSLNKPITLPEIIDFPMDNSSQIDTITTSFLSPHTQKFLWELRTSAFGINSDSVDEIETKQVVYIGYIDYTECVRSQVFLFNKSTESNIHKIMSLITYKNDKIVGIIDIRLKHLDFEWGMSSLIQAYDGAEGEILIRRNNPSDVIVVKEAIRELSRKQKKEYNHGQCARISISKNGRVRLKRL